MTHGRYIFGGSLPLRNAIPIVLQERLNGAARVGAAAALFSSGEQAFISMLYGRVYAESPEAYRKLSISEVGAEAPESRAKAYHLCLPVLALPSFNSYGVVSDRDGDQGCHGFSPSDGAYSGSQRFLYALVSRRL